MYKLDHSVFINRSPQEVFDYLADPANTVQWQSGTESAEWISDGPPGIGSVYKVGAKFLGRKVETEMEILGWDPPNMLSYKTVNGPIPLKNTTTFEVQGDGTLLTHSIQTEFGTFFRLAEGLVGKQVEKQVASDNAALKLLLEMGEE